MNNAGVDATNCFDIEITVDAASDKYDNVKVIWNIQQFFMQLRKKVYHHIEITKERDKVHQNTWASRKPLAVRCTGLDALCGSVQMTTKIHQS